MATHRPKGFILPAKTSFILVISIRLSTPYRSQANLLRALMAIGLSILPRRQAVSQGAAQMRPQMEAKGFGSLAT
jgi:hypothetical protein